jgi:hypothetical protein
MPRGNERSPLPPSKRNTVAEPEVPTTTRKSSGAAGTLAGRKEAEEQKPAPVQKASPAPAKTTQVNTRVASGMAKADVSAMLLEDEGAGSESMTKDDLAIPRISILQSLSPQCTKADPAYIQGAEAGEFISNIDGSLFSGENGIVIIPVSYRRANLEWKPRKAGGGFVADHGTDDTIIDTCTKDPEKGTLVTPKGTEIVPTAEYYCIMIHPDTDLPQQVVISMAKSQLKKAKKWNTVMSNLMVPKPDGHGAFNPAMFYRAYRITTVPESNDQGSWFGFDIKAECDTLEMKGGQDLYLGARQFRKAVTSGEVMVAAPISGVADDAGVGKDSDSPM